MAILIASTLLETETEAWYSFYVDTMLFVLKQYEEEVNYKLLSDDEVEEGLYFKMNEKVLLRTDSKTQMEVFTMAVNSGIYVINETRAKLDLEGVEGGDRPIVNGSMTPLDVVNKKTGTDTTTTQQPPGGNQKGGGEGGND